MVEISEKEIEELDMLEKIDFDLLIQFERSLEDVKAGRIIRVE